MSSNSGTEIDPTLITFETNIEWIWSLSHVIYYCKIEQHQTIPIWSHLVLSWQVIKEWSHTFYRMTQIYVKVTKYWTYRIKLQILIHLPCSDKYIVIKLWTFPKNDILFISEHTLGISLVGNIAVCLGGNGNQEGH